MINLSIKLTEHYGSGWSEKTMRHCLRAAETFSEEDILSATQRQLTWTHLKSLMYIKDPLERQFYAQICSAEHWDTRTRRSRGQVIDLFTKKSKTCPSDLTELGAGPRQMVRVCGLTYAVVYPKIRN